MKTKTIKQTVSFPATPDILYALLFDSKKMTTILGSKATFSRRPKGKFSVFDGYCHGYNIALEEGRRIEQAWHFEEDGWPADYYSICTFNLSPATKGTKLAFSQLSVPEHMVESIKEGWKAYYWGPILQYLLT